MRRDPEVSAHFQVWTFLYATGTPVLFNALELRQQLEKTIRDLDPNDHDFATRHIVVLGHSMGGLMRAHIGQLERREVVELVVRGAAAAIAR